MRLSRLQKYILLLLAGARGSLTRKHIESYYKSYKNPPSKEDQQNIITKSIERLIRRGLLIGYGRKTPQKWFIDEIRLTTQGKKEAKKLLGQQQVLPLYLRKKIKK